MQERNTPLHLAVAKECNEKIVTALLWAGAEKNALNQAGQTRYVSIILLLICVLFACHLLWHESSLMTKTIG
jgi:ankyrin repeat protein